MNAAEQEIARALTYSPLASPESIDREPNPFPSTSVAQPEESWFGDWRERLTHNLARRSDARWEPLTHTHASRDSAP
jgi:hypothetical protein